jgi:hypothetical protein
MNKEILEALADLEHQQWMEWAGKLLDSEQISLARKNRWLSTFMPYEVLSEKNKEKDRYWARKIMEMLKRKGVL